MKIYLPAFFVYRKQSSLFLYEPFSEITKKINPLFQNNISALKSTYSKQNRTLPPSSSSKISNASNIYPVTKKKANSMTITNSASNINHSFAKDKYACLWAGKGIKDLSIEDLRLAIEAYESFGDSTDNEEEIKDLKQEINKRSKLC